MFITAILVEVFQVCIDKFDDDIERQGELYGKIGVADLGNPMTLYHRERGNPEHIRANSTISLEGPNRSIHVVIGFALNIDLRLCGDLEDVPLCKWQLSWDVMEPEVAHITRASFLKDFCDRTDMLSSEADCKYQSAGYNQPLSAVFEGPDGCCVTLYYAILSHAVQAWVQIEVIDVNADPTVVEYNVCGTISATYGHFETNNDSSIKDYCKTTLIKRRYLESMKVQRWKKVQLSRNIIAVPASSSLIIQADLWDSTSHLRVAQGKVEFTPCHFGYAVDYISGDDDCAIRVMVSWLYGSKIPKRAPF